MNICMVRVLGAEDTSRIAKAISAQSFSDGRATAQGYARDLKHNLQLEAGQPGHEEPARAVLAALDRSAAFQAFTVPRRIAPPMFSRYEPGMTYGRHVDAAMMGGYGGLRTDFSVTLFLSPPASYEGGELVIDDLMGEQTVKLDAGEAVIYPANTIHQVAPVTRGARLAAVTWVQSAIRDDRMRVIVADLRHALTRVEASGDADLTLCLTKTYQDLIRYAVEP